MSDVWIQVITALSHSKSCPWSKPPYSILNLVLQTKRNDLDDQDDQYNQDDQDTQEDQDDQDDQDKDKN